MTVIRNDYDVNRAVLYREYRRELVHISYRAHRNKTVVRFYVTMTQHRRARDVLCRKWYRRQQVTHVGIMEHQSQRI